MNTVSAIGTLFSGIDFQSRQGFTVARMALDQAEAQGEASVDMIRAAASVTKGVDNSPRHPIGPLGHTLDVSA